MLEINEKYELRDIRKFCVGVAMDARASDDEVTAESIVTFAAEIEKFVLGGESENADAPQPGRIVHERD